MVKSLLVGTNGSQWSQTAVKLGLELARRHGVPVTFLGVVDVPGLIQGEPLPIGGTAFKSERDAQLLAEAKGRIEAALQSAAAQAAEAGVKSSVRYVEGSPAEQLGVEVQLHDLLIIGKRAVPKTDHDPAASKTMTEILRHAPRPVIVAGEEVPETPTVAVAYDGSRQAARTLASFVASGIHADHQVTVLGVGDDVPAISATVDRAVAFLELHGRTSSVRILSASRGVPQALLEATQQAPPGMLVMGVYGQPRIKEALFGSVTRTMLARVPVPLFLDH